MLELYLSSPLLIEVFANELFAKVLCCCNTSMGQCCAWVSFCGSIIPGCLCL